MTNPSLHIAWSIAEIEASAAGFQAILPSHFWIGCKGCDLDFAKFLQNSPPEIRKQETQIARDFQAVRDALTAGKAKPAKLRRALRATLGKEGDPTPRPLHRHPELRAAFVAGRHLAGIAGGSIQPVHMLFSLLRTSDPLFDECLSSIDGNRKSLLEALERCVLVDGFDAEGVDANCKVLDPVSERLVDDFPPQPFGLLGMKNQTLILTARVIFPLAIPPRKRHFFLSTTVKRLCGVGA